MANINLTNAPFIDKQFIVTTAFSVSHKGLDLAPYGYAGNLYAIDHFKLLYKNYDNSYGNYAIFSNENGTLYLYAHMMSLPTKSINQVYNLGEYIAPSGTTGNSTGVHLHLEMQHGTSWTYRAPFSTYINPCDYLTGIINVASSSNVYYYDGTPTPTPTPVITTNSKHFKWSLFSKRNKIISRK